MHCECGEINRQYCAEIRYKLRITHSQRMTLSPQQQNQKLPWHLAWYAARIGRQLIAKDMASNQRHRRRWQRRLGSACVAAERAKCNSIDFSFSVLLPAKVRATMATAQAKAMARATATTQTKCQMKISQSTHWTSILLLLLVLLLLLLLLFALMPIFVDC